MPSESSDRKNAFSDLHQLYTKTKGFGLFFFERNKPELSDGPPGGTTHCQTVVRPVSPMFTIWRKEKEKTGREGENAPRPCASKRVDALTTKQTLQTFENKLHWGRVSLPLPPPAAPARKIDRTPGILRLVLASKIYRENKYFLFMHPLNSDPSRHVDDIGATNHTCRLAS